MVTCLSALDLGGSYPAFFEPRLIWQRFVQEQYRSRNRDRDDLRQGRRAEMAFWPDSLDAPLAGQASMIMLADVLGEEDPRMEHMLGMQAVATHWGELPAREREILLMDFRGGMTQTQIGQQLRMSQMQVSRLRARALGYLRSRLLDLEGTSAAKEPHAVATGASRLCGGGIDM